MDHTLNSGDPSDEAHQRAVLTQREIRTCLVCGTKFSATNNSEYCPVCVLRGVLGGECEATETLNTRSGSKQVSSEATPPTTAARFEHYELLWGEDGQPIELGRGAMGITYKAFDIDLRYPVTLKVISERYLGDEAAKLRFLREARAAASVRHPNVASVFHLGRTGANYFYAMEFVEGETLEHLIKRSGRLDVKLALEIANQVAAGLAAVHKKNLVHRDIKPANIMVCLEDGGGVTAKVIDLGLAKLVNELGSQGAISMPGVFAGTPEFASPEQFGGVGVDIRADLYSLGVVLWNMVTGHALFKGSAVDVMYQHQHSPLPLEQLEGVPEPVAVLLEVLLEKDPAQRFQTPTELLKMVPTITGAIDVGRRITQGSLQKTPADSRAIRRRPSARPGPKKISVARLPVTGSDIFGREEDIAFLDNAWANQDVNVVTIVAWAGVGKSTLVNHWLRRMAAEHYRSAQLVFGWSFYREGSSGGTSSADEFLDTALSWFGDSDPRIGTAWKKGERLAKLIARRRTLLILDGLEPLQNPPGPQEGRVRELSLQALLCELAAFNTGLCVITTRLPIVDIADHEHTSAPRLELEHLSNDAGAKLLRALSVRGDEEKLRTISEEFNGHCLSLTLLGSYLTDAYNGDIRCCGEISAGLAQDVRQGVHARKVMESYQNWFGEGPELSFLRILGLFDRPTDEKALRALLKPPAIRGLTESLSDLNPTEWRTLVARLRRARLIGPEDPYNPWHLDTHPLVREYFGELFRSQRTEAWKECNRRLYHYYRTVAPELPDNFREMEPLFLAVICGCNAGLFRDALHEVYLARIQRGNASFAAKALGARGALLSMLVHFFEHGRWDSFVETDVDGQSLTAEDQLFILMQAALNLVATRGMGATEARICCERAESLCHSLNRPLLLYSALIGQWCYSLMTDRLTATMQIAKRVHSLAQELNDSAFIMGSYVALEITSFFLGNFEAARQYAMRGIQLWRLGVVRRSTEEMFLDVPAVSCLIFDSLSAWHLGEIASCKATMAEAISLAQELNDTHALAEALFCAAVLGQSDPAQAERSASDLIEVSRRHNFGFWLACGAILRGWARSASGNTAEGLSWIEDGIRDYRATGSVLMVPYFLALKARALHLADRTPEALEAINEAEALVERCEVRHMCATLHTLRGVFLAAMGADETQIEASFSEAIRIAKEQKSVSLEKRAEGTCAEYHRQKASASGCHGFRLPLF
jgi:serine/threonine protein kinase